MRLLDLGARFIAWTGTGFEYVADLAAAQGLLFQCPACAAGKPLEPDSEDVPAEVGAPLARRVAVGAHRVVCWFSNPVGGLVAPPEADHGSAHHPRWRASGATLEDLTLAPSVLLLTGCRWHGWVQGGEAR